MLLCRRPNTCIALLSMDEFELLSILLLVMCVLSPAMLYLGRVPADLLQKGLWGNFGRF